jgi:hypothetical protein
VEAFNLLFHVLTASNNRLLAAIFLQHWVKRHYASLENLQIQEILRQNSLIAYRSEQLPQVRSQIVLAIVTIGLLDFPANTYLLENVPRDTDVSYQLLKCIVKKKQFIYREKLEFIFNTLNVSLQPHFD